MRKTKKLLSAILALTLGVGATLGFTACGEETPPSETSSETSSGTGEHTCSLEYDYDATHHWIVCTDCGETQEKATHVDKGMGECDVCKNPLPTEGVVYELSSDGTYALVTGYDGIETRVAIAPSYNGVPVTEIAPSAFSNHGDLRCVTLTKHIQKIGDSAFRNCIKLEGIKLSLGVTEIGTSVFENCEKLTVFCEAESAPSGWGENWNVRYWDEEGNATRCFVLWGYQGERMTAVSPKGLTISSGMLNVDKPENRQIVENSDLGNVEQPEEFSTVTRFDAQTEGGKAWGEGKSALWNYNFDSQNLIEYGEIWFAAKLVNASWVFVDSSLPHLSPPSWVYFYLKQTSTDQLGNAYWTIEVSFGGQVYAKFENQSGSFIDKDRPQNSIARMFFDDGFHSPDKNAVLIYGNHPTDVSIYCTEILGVKVGY